MTFMHVTIGSEVAVEVETGSIEAVKSYARCFSFDYHRSFK